MFMQRLGPRITLLMAAAALAMALGSVSLFAVPMRQLMLDQAARQAMNLAQVISAELLTFAPGQGGQALDALVERIAIQEQVVQVAVLDAGGRLLASNKPDSSLRPGLVQEALRTGAPVRSVEGGRPIVAFPSSAPEGPVVYLEMDAGAFLAQFGGLLAFLLGVTLLVMLLMHLIGGRILRRLVINRLQQVAEGLSRVRAGQMDYRLPVEPKSSQEDEISNLAQHFNAMVQELQERTTAQSRAETRLQTAYEDLESKVAERTRELAQANDQLSAQVEERRQAEWRLQEHQMFLSTVLEGIQAAIFVLDPIQGRMVSSNSVAQALTHLSEEEIMVLSCGQDSVTFVADGRVMNLLCPDWSEQDSYLEGVVHLPDGKTFPASRQLMEIIIDGKAHLVEIVFDITERKNLERRLGMAQKLESIGLLAAGIAHEINTPVQYVGDSVRFVRDAFADILTLLHAYAALRIRAGEADLAKEEVRRVNEAETEADLEFLEDEVPKACGRALDGLERVARIVQAMKNFSHPGTEEKKLTDINKAVQNTVIVARNEWKYVAEVETDLAPDLPLVSCYAADINQVLLNMLVNAAHAIVDLPGEGVRGRITISTRQEGEFAEIRVTDTGIGIPPQNLERIFDPFFTTKPVGKGTGQGLTIAHDIVVNKHRGRIDVESQVGQGTTFTIRLPLETLEQGSTV